MTRKQIVNIVNITFLISGLYFMYIKVHTVITFIGIGFFVSSVLTLLFNNINNK